MARRLVSELQTQVRHRCVENRPAGRISRIGAPPGAMAKELSTRFAAVLLAVVTVAVIVFAGINFAAERQFRLPYDGVWWVEGAIGLVAKKVDPAGPAARAGLRAGDILRTVGGEPIPTTAQLNQSILHAGLGKQATYEVERDGATFKAPVVLAGADRSFKTALRLIGLFYLGIGLYVLLRRWTAPRSTHFYLFCLTSFIFYSFKFTGKLNPFDLIIYWSNVVAELLQPALFLHFVLVFPEVKASVRRHRWIIPLVYVGAVLILAARIVCWKLLPASELLLWNLDRLTMLHQAVLFVIAAAVLWHTYRHARTSIMRQQMKWVTRGTSLAVAPWLVYVATYIRGDLPGLAAKLCVLSLVLLPLTFGYAIFRYRLIDVDVIFKRGMAYTLAAAAIIGIYFAAVAAAAALVRERIPNAGTAGLVIAVAVTALLFEPVKNWIQAHLDKLFYRQRYDYRRTLIDFGRELSSKTDLDHMLTSTIERLSHTLDVDRCAIFLAEPDIPDRYALARSSGIGDLSNLDLGFLASLRPETAAGHLFFDNTHQVVRESRSAQETIARLDLNYYIPSVAQRRTIAVLGLGKTHKGDFLSSEDVELLETLAGYLAIAIQNARLYCSLERKALEYERLRDFNENIVESISVGVLTVDLQDRVEFWNSQMEVLFARPRAEVVGRSIAEVFPAQFTEEFYRVRQDRGVHNFYKFKLETPAGEMHLANIAIAPLVTRDFQEVGRLIIIDDITERVGLESQLTQAEKMSSIGLLAAGVAHEVNTPLAVISSYTQMLAKQLSEDEPKAQLLERMRGQVSRASEIVNNLLNFSRTSNAQFGPVDVNKVITDTLSLLEHQLKTSKIDVHQQLASDLPLIYGNAGKLQQVFLNLFMNARDAMPSGGTLRVWTGNGNTVRVMVSDSGTGIPREYLDRIYDPFFTTKISASDSSRRGTGLGLSVTYGIIHEHAGKISVESQPGQGTTFYLDFPRLRKAVNA